MDYTNYISPELLVLVPALCAVGSNLKSTEKIKDKYIPLIISLCGIGLAVMYTVSTQGMSALGLFTATVQGILTAAVAVYSNQMYKQTKKER